MPSGTARRAAKPRLPWLERVKSPKAKPVEKCLGGNHWCLGNASARRNRRTSPLSRNPALSTGIPLGTQCESGWQFPTYTLARRALQCTEFYNMLFNQATQLAGYGNGSKHSDPRMEKPADMRVTHALSAGITRIDFFTITQAAKPGCLRPVMKHENHGSVLDLAFWRRVKPGF